jgi:hypothetical protein
MSPLTPVPIFNKVEYEMSEGSTIIIFLRRSVVPFPAGFCYRQAAILLRLLGTTVIVYPPYNYIEHLNLSLTAYLVLHSLVTQTYPNVPRATVGPSITRM